MNHSAAQLESPEACPPLASPPSGRTSLPAWLWAIPVGWTLLLALALGWNMNHERLAVQNLAQVAARSSLEKDLLFRQWATLHGGVYVPVTDQTPPNPYLGNIPERDLTTPSGRALTLMNPAYMTRQVHELGRKMYRHHGHITSLKPIRPENAPDGWERQALEAFERGVVEVSSVESIAGEAHLRLMRPLKTAAGCLKCHAAQGYQEGDIRGGLSVAVPMKAYDAVVGPHQRWELLAHSGIWGLGLVAFGASAWQLLRRQRERERDQVKLRESEEIFRQFMAHSPIHVFFKDEKIRAIQLSRNFETLLGRPLGELLGKSMEELFPSELAKSMVADDRRIMNEGKEVTVEEEFNGRFYLTTKFPIVVEGKSRFLAGYTQDITERKRAEKELKERLEELVAWQNVTIGREGRVMELKIEVNELLAKLGQPSRYENPGA